MTASRKKNIRFILVSTILITYIIVKVIYKITGFHYDLADGILNIRFLIDIALWGFVYLTVYSLLKKLLLKKTE